MKRYFQVNLLVCLMSIAFLGGVNFARAQTNPAVAEKSPSLVLITIDTLRADHLGCYGYDKIETPNIDRLATEGVLFTRNYTPVPITLPSHVSIMTGLYPPTHGVRNNGTCLLGDSALTLAEILKEHQYCTAAFVGAYVLHSRFGLAQGFDLYDDRFPSSENVILPLFNERAAAEVMDSAFEWLIKHQGEKFFLWIHLFDPHAPYSPPSPFREPYKLSPYDGEIAYVDSQIGRLRHKLTSLNLDKNTMMVLTADHGEGLDDHGEKTHAVFIYDSTLRVPLIFHGPGLLPSSREIEENVCTIDIVPTVLDILKIPVPAHLQGYSLTSLMRGEQKKPDRRFYCESHYPELNFGWSRLEGIRTNEWKFIEAPRSELYRIDQDPGELYNKVLQENATAATLKKDLHDWKKELTAAGENLSVSRTVSLDAETKKRLEGLGYVWDKPQGTKEQHQLPDPKDMIQTLLDMDVAMFYSALGLYQKAVEYLEKVVQANPANIKAHFYLAANYEKVEKYDESIAEYQKVIRMDPDYSEAYNSLGAVFDKKGLTDQALVNFEMAQKLNGNYMEVYYNLGVVYNKMKQYEKALRYLEQANRLYPNHPSVRNNLGSVYIKLGKLGEAVEEFQHVINLDPNHGEAYNNLGIAYKLLGEHEKAEESFRRALQLNPNNAGAYSNLAGFFIMKKQYEQAITSCKEALHCDENWVEAFVNLGIAYFYLNHYQEAISNLEKALSLDELQTEAYLNLGLCYLFLKDYEKAQKYYRKGLELDPRNSKGHINLGTIYFKQNNIPEAIAEWEKSLELDPNSIEAHMNLGSAYLKQGEHYQAIKKWKRVLESDPDHVTTHLNLGNCYYQMGLTNLAIAEWSKTAALDDSSIAAHSNLAAAYQRQGVINLAAQEWEKVASLNPDDEEALYNLGMIYLNRGNYDQAITSLSRALRIKPDFAEARALLDRARWLKGESPVENNDKEGM